jgi:rubrerythrin
MRNFIFLLAWAFTKLPNHLILLKRLEIGVFFFCWRLALKAEAENQAILARSLKKQAESEYHHAQLLSNLTGSKLLMSASGLFDREDRSSFNWGSVDWDSSEEFRADGLSRRYICARVLFGGQFAKDFDINNQLAFMAVLEELQAEFYAALLNLIHPNSERYLRAIATDEASHSDTLRELLSFHPDAQQLIRKWRWRTAIAFLFVPLDLAYLLCDHTGGESTLAGGSPAVEEWRTRKGQ